MIDAAQIADIVSGHLDEVASSLRPDVLEALQNACRRESSKQGKAILEILIENAQLAADKDLPLCQDTGTVWVLVELGAKAKVDLRGLQDFLDKLIAQKFKEQHLRASTIRDAFCDRSNPGNNTPAFVEIVQNSEQNDKSDLQVRVSTMLKGAGTDNVSAVYMLSPGKVEEEIVKLVLDLVREKGVNACPPLVVGLGIGGTFDKVASLSKRALLRPLMPLRNQVAGNEEVAQLEERILSAINSTNIGPAGFGGGTTALAVNIETAPSHIASLPLAVNFCCHALRSRTTAIEAALDSTALYS